MRKTKLTYEMVDRAVALKKDGLCDADIIAALGVHQSTFYRWLKEPDTKVKRALCEGLDDMFISSEPGRSSRAR